MDNDNSPQTVVPEPPKRVTESVETVSILVLLIAVSFFVIASILGILGAFGDDTFTAVFSVFQLLCLVIGIVFVVNVIVHRIEDKRIARNNIALGVTTNQRLIFGWSSRLWAVISVLLLVLYGPLGILIGLYAVWKNWQKHKIISILLATILTICTLVSILLFIFLRDLQI